MKLTVCNGYKKAIFEKGDFFLNESGKLRQISKQNTMYVILNPMDNFKVAAECPGAISATDAVEHYASFNGPIKKVVVKEIIVELTGEEIIND